jgi:hypothetical protein
MNSVNNEVLDAYKPWSELVALMHSELVEFLMENTSGHLLLWFPLPGDGTEEEEEEEESWIGMTGNWHYRPRAVIRPFGDEMTFSLENETTGGDEYEIDIDGQISHSVTEWGSDPKLDEQFQEWFEAADSDQLRGVILLVNAIKAMVGDSSFEASELSVDWGRPWAD